MRKIRDRIYEVGAIDWDRRLFDELIPLPDGTSYNAYLVCGSEKTALLDTVDPAMADTLIDNLVRTGVEKIDYIVAHHAEQDHSGVINEILTFYPEAQVVANAKCRDLLIEELQIDEERFLVIEDGQKISLGNKTLQFIFTPWVHWPETMGTYVAEDKIFFSCDFFGAHLACSELFAKDTAKVYDSAKRYYAEIMMPFRSAIKKNLEKLEGYEIDTIAPSHGPLHENPQFIIDAYKQWVGDSVTNEVVLPYVSMHGSTKKMVEYLADALMERQIQVKQFNLTCTDIGSLAMSLVDAATIVIAAPTMLGKAHPVAAYGCMVAAALKPKTKFAAVIGSYGWGGQMTSQIENIFSGLKAEMLEGLMIKGYPKDADFEQLERLADDILDKHRQIGLL